MTLDQRLTRSARAVVDGLTPPAVDIDAIRARVRSNRRRTALLATGATVAALVAVGVTAVAGRDTAATDPMEPAPTPTSSPSSSGDLVQATRLEDVTVGSPLTPGRYAFAFVSEQGDAPVALVDVPAGYEASGNAFEIGSERDSPFRHFDAWTVATVATDACGEVDWVDPGPSVGDLADALAALPVWDSTQPVARTIDGHEGVYMELNAPAEVPAECQGGELLSYRDHEGGTQGIGLGKTQRLWIADVDGHRLMLVAGYFPGPEGPTPEQVDELRLMAEGATFVDAAQVAP